MNLLLKLMQKIIIIHYTLIIITKNELVFILKIFSLILIYSLINKQNT